MRVLAIDPGTVQSGFVVWDDGIVEAAIVENEHLLARIIENDFGAVQLCALEMVASYGMSVGREIFETVFWIGRFYERAQRATTTIRVFRKDIKLYLCGSPRAKDPNIRQALIDKHGAPGTKKQPGRTYGISGHLWAALAVADYALSLQ